MAAVLASVWLDRVSWRRPVHACVRACVLAFSLGCLPRSPTDPFTNGERFQNGPRQRVSSAKEEEN